MKPVIVSTAICQRPGISSRFMPSATKPQITMVASTIHSALLVKAIL